MGIAMPRHARPGAHDALLDAAREEFARRGLDGARVEDVARRARMSKGAFYLHFESKDAAFHEIVQRFLGALEDHSLRRQDVENRLRDDAADPGAVARHIEEECAIDTDLLELLWRNRQIVSAVDGAGGKLYPSLLADFRARMRALVARRIVDRQGSGRLRPNVDPDVIADIIVGTYEDFARRMIDMNRKPDLAAWSRSFLVVLYEGILERSAKADPHPARRRAPPTL
jgi:AcrR family transcriptional regulator